MNYERMMQCGCRICREHVRAIDFERSQRRPTGFRPELNSPYNNFPPKDIYREFVLAMQNSPTWPTLVFPKQLTEQLMQIEPTKAIATADKPLDPALAILLNNRDSTANARNSTKREADRLEAGLAEKRTVLRDQDRRLASYNRALKKLGYKEA